MEAGGEHLRIIHPQRGENIHPCARIGRRRQRDTRHTGEAARQHREFTIFRPELVAPLADAMRLINRDQRDVLALQPFHRPRRQQPLRRDVEQIQPPIIQRPPHLAMRFRVQFGMQGRRRHAQLAHRRHLIVHQRDQRRNHHRRARPAQSRHLIAERLAAARRHQHQGIAAADHTVDRRFLQAAKAGEAKNRPQHIPRRAMRVNGVHRVEPKPGRVPLTVPPPPRGPMTGDRCGPAAPHRSGGGR